MQLHCSRSFLRNLTILLWYTIYENGFNIDGSVLKHLLVFPNIQSLELSAKTPFSLDNETVRDVAAAWPQLSRLVLGGYGWFQKSRIMPAGLMPLLSLRSLSKLHIAVNGFMLDPRLEPVSIGTCS